MAQLKDLIVTGQAYFNNEVNFAKTSDFYVGKLKSGNAIIGLYNEENNIASQYQLITKEGFTEFTSIQTGALKIEIPVSIQGYISLTIDIDDNNNCSTYHISGKMNTTSNGNKIWQNIAMNSCGSDYKGYLPVRFLCETLSGQSRLSGYSIAIGNVTTEWEKPKIILRNIKLDQGINFPSDQLNASFSITFCSDNSILNSLGNQKILYSDGLSQSYKTSSSISINTTNTSIFNSTQIPFLSSGLYYITIKSTMTSGSGSGSKAIHADNILWIENSTSNSNFSYTNSFTLPSKTKNSIFTITIQYETNNIGTNIYMKSSIPGDAFIELYLYKVCDL